MGPVGCQLMAWALFLASPVGLAYTGAVVAPGASWGLYGRGLLWVCGRGHGGSVARTG